MRFSGATIFVTGGAGFIGSAAARHLLDHTDPNVVNIDKLTYAGNLASIPQAQGSRRSAFAKVDISNGAELRAVFGSYPPDAVMNLAAESHVDRSIDGPSEFIQTDIVGTFTLLQEALRYWRSLSHARRAAFRLLHVSTDEVYGSLGADGLFTERTAYAPNSPYSASKAASDHLVRALVLARGRVGETYNVGGRCERTNIHVVQTICDHLDRLEPSRGGPRKRLISFVRDRPGHDRRYAIDPTKIETELGRRAQETFETGLEKTVGWFLANRAWWRSILDRGYEARRIGVVACV